MAEIPTPESPPSTEGPTVSVLGLPYDGSSSFLAGPALAPPRIREALASSHSHMTTECGLDLGADRRWRDVGDLDLTGGGDPSAKIQAAVGDLLRQGQRVLCLGGDHWVSAGILAAYGEVHANLTVLHLDAHPDLYDALDGDRTSHACPFARIMEGGNVGRLVQVGIRTLNAHQRRQAERFGVEVIEMRHWTPNLDLRLDGPLYLSLDLDVLDPAFAPGISHHEPGGMTTRDVIALIQNLPAPLVGADLVELNPLRDINGMTATVAAKLTKEILARLLDGPEARPSRPADAG